MKLKVIATGSTGNSYILEGKQESLLLEAGVPMKQVLIASGFDTRRLVGCLVSHSHGDHAKCVKDVLKYVIPVYTSKGTATATRIADSAGLHIVRSMESFKVGGFTVLPFDTAHDAPEPLGFYISHPECGNTLFATDTRSLPYNFAEMNNIIIECNYDDDILRENYEEGRVHAVLRRRIIDSHMSLKNCITTMQGNDLKAVNNIVLIHASSGNSDVNTFCQRMKEATGKTVTVATPGRDIELNVTPF